MNPYDDIDPNEQPEPQRPTDRQLLSAAFVVLSGLLQGWKTADEARRVALEIAEHLQANP